MNFRVKNIKKGYCEIWANMRTGERYQILAKVLRDEASNGIGKTWHWSAKHNEPPFYMPFFTHEFRTRRECINDCERWALKRLVERAIKRQTRKVQSWHMNDPRGTAWHYVTASHLFTHEELVEIKRRLETFEGEK